MKKKNFFVYILFLFMCGCLINDKKNELNNNLNFSDELTFEEFSKKLRSPVSAIGRPRTSRFSSVTDRGAARAYAHVITKVNLA